MFVDSSSLDELAPVVILEQFAKEQLLREHGFGWVTYADHCRETSRLDEELKKAKASEDEWRKCNLGIIRLCSEVEHSLQKTVAIVAEKDRRIEELEKLVEQYSERVQELSMQVCDGA